MKLYELSNAYKELLDREDLDPQAVVDTLDAIKDAIEIKADGIASVIDDICVMIEQAICLEAGVQALSDIPYGKGFATFNGVLQQFVMDLKALPMNVIYVSRELAITDEQTGTTEKTPSLKTKYYNIVNGNCDLVIHTEKFGKDTYTRTITDRRTKYEPENIKDARVKKLLESCTGMF